MQNTKGGGGRWEWLGDRMKMKIQENKNCVKNGVKGLRIAFFFINS